MSTIAVVLARMGSSRLAGKMLLDVHGEPLLGLLLRRLKRARRIDAIVVATSDQPGDDAIAEFCQGAGVTCHRGSEADVLRRLAGALKEAKAETGVLVFGDCPLVDPAIIDELVETFEAHDGAFDFVGNDLRTTYPPGAEAEVFRAEALMDANRRCDDAAVREHGTLYVRQNPDLYRLHNVTAPEHFHRPELELEVDTAEDIEVVRAIVAGADGGADAGLAEIIAFMDAHPQIQRLNADVPRRWKSYRNEQT